MNANEYDSTWDQAPVNTVASEVDDVAVPEENELIHANSYSAPETTAPALAPPVSNGGVPTPPVASVTDIKQQVSDTASHVMTQVKASAGQVLDQSKQSAGQAVDAARQQVIQQLTTQKGRAADAIGNFQAPINEITETFTNHGQPQLSSLSRSVGDRIGQASDYLRTSDLDIIARDAQVFAKANPAIVIGGAFVLGILAARFFKSTAAPVASTDALLPVVQPAYAAAPTAPTASIAPTFGRRDEFDDSAIPETAPITAHGYVAGGVLGGANT